VNDTPMSRDELKTALADYLADELPPEARQRFEAGLRDHADLAEEARSLANAVRAMRALDEELAPAQAAAAPPPARHHAGWRGAGRLLRLAAMLALAFGLGYAARGPGSGPGSGPGPGPGAQTAERPAGEATGGSTLETRYAMQYLADGQRSGLGRALVAFSRAVNESPSSQTP